MECHTGGGASSLGDSLPQGLGDTVGKAFEGGAGRVLADVSLRFQWVRRPGHEHVSADVSRCDAFRCCIASGVLVSACPTLRVGGGGGGGLSECLGGRVSNSPPPPLWGWDICGSVGLPKICGGWVPQITPRPTPPPRPPPPPPWSTKKRAFSHSLEPPSVTPQMPSVTPQMPSGTLQPPLVTLQPPSVSAAFSQHRRNGAVFFSCFFLLPRTALGRGAGLWTVYRRRALGCVRTQCSSALHSAAGPPSCRCLRRPPLPGHDQSVGPGTRCGIHGGCGRGVSGVLEAPVPPLPPPFARSHGPQSSAEQLSVPWGGVGIEGRGLTPPPLDPEFIVRKTEIVQKEMVIWLFLVHKHLDFWVPGPPPPLLSPRTPMDPRTSRQ